MFVFSLSLKEVKMQIVRKCFEDKTFYLDVNKRENKGAGVFLRDVVTSPNAHVVIT